MPTTSQKKPDYSMHFFIFLPTTMHWMLHAPSICLPLLAEFQGRKVCENKIYISVYMITPVNILQECSPLARIQHLGRKWVENP